MNRMTTRPIRFYLISGLSLVLCSCGGSGSTAVDTPDPGNPPPEPPPPVLLADAATDHAFLTDHFSGSQNCSLCHDGLQDENGQDLSIVADWKATMMAAGSRDPLWRAKVASEIKRFPELREEIESECARCHVPMAHVEAEFVSADVTLFDDGLLHPDNVLFDAAAESVSCTLCHQVSDTAELGTDDGFSGSFEIPFSFGTARLAFGQYSNLLTAPMVNQVAFTPTMSPHISDSEMCATCHNLSTTVIDSQGSPTNQTFPEQMVYTEWENSSFAATQSCQDCHMPRAAGNVTISTRPMNSSLPARPDFARHIFVGANTYMLDVLASNANELNISTLGIGDHIDETRAFLGSSVSLALEDLARVGDQLQFAVRLSNHAGHKFPTSYPSRRAWLHVSITDAQDTTVFESGAVDTDGQISGLASDANLGNFEPHYQAITSADQVQSYETIMENIDGDLTYTLLRAARYRKDNRVLPSGMDKAAVPETIRPRGEAFDDPDFVGGSDAVRYLISGLAAGNYRIDVRLNYQPVGYNFIQDLVRDNDEPRVALFQELNAAASIRYETIVSVSDSINF